MPPKLKQFLQRWIIGTVAVLLAATILPGIHYRDWPDLVLATFILGLLNTFVRPLMMLLSLPLIIFSLGLFTIVINALLLMLVSKLLGDRFQVDGFGHALLGALIVSVVSVALQSLTGSGSVRVQYQRGPRPPRDRNRRDPNDKDDNGPVIDV